MIKVYSLEVGNQKIEFSADVYSIFDVIHTANLYGQPYRIKIEIL